MKVKKRILSFEQIEVLYKPLSVPCLFFILVFLSIGCSEKEINNIDSDVTNFEQILSTYSHIDFVNTVADKADLNIINYRNFYNGGGVGIGDVNNDGLKDIYFTSNMNANKLYLNLGDMKFEDISEKAGIGASNLWSTGVSMVDINADGFIDIYVCNSVSEKPSERKNKLFINNGDLTFSERAMEFGLDDTGNSVHASFFDYDKDGDLDCFVLNNSYSDPQKIAKTASGARFNYSSSGGDRFYINTSGRFEDYTEESGIFSGDTGFGLGVSVGDLNGDYFPDLYVSNDFWERDYLYINQQDGTFREMLTETFDYVSANSMGSDIGDLNNDGLLDLFSTDMLPATNRRMKSAIMFEEYFLAEKKWKDSYYFQFIMNCLHINNGNGKFSETGFFSGVAATDWSWGALIFDMNNDGLKDIFVSNGIYNDITDLDFIDFVADEASIKSIIREKGKFEISDFVERLPNNEQVNFSFINEGGLKFRNKSEELGLSKPSYSNGAAYGDLDNDGDLDLVINNLNTVATVYQNNTDQDTASNFIKIKLQGNKSNLKGLGTRVNLYHGNTIQTQVSIASRGFQSSSDSDILFGLSQGAEIDSMVAIWPTNEKQVISGEDIKLNTVLTLNIENASLSKINREEMSQNFEEVGRTLLTTSIRHSENVFNDYNQESLIPHVLSTEGPKIIKGDVNADGKEDFVILGAAGYSDRLFLFQNGQYIESKQEFFDFDKASESTCGVLFDADNDQDLDLLVGVGGNDFSKNFDEYTSKFYINDGSGNFSKEALMGPYFIGQVSCIKPCDFDRDGDLDLFVGGYSVPGNYGLTPRSFLLRNEGGNKFTDITNEFTGPLGMVKDASWVDVNGDNWPDLIVVGEWMPITVLLQDDKTLVEGYTLPNSNGWWNSIVPADFNNDGEMDYIVGNWGENMKFSASAERPLTIYIADFDENGKVEPVIDWYFGEERVSYPFASKKDLTNQIPSLKKQSLKYSDYAKKKVQDLFPQDMLEKAVRKYADNFSTSILMTENNNLKLKRLSNVQAQLSPVFATLAEDIDEDGIVDLVLGGNFYFLKPEVGRHDGLKGGYYKGRGDGNFNFIGPEKSGLDIKGEVRDIQRVNEHIIVARNKNEVLIFKDSQLVNL